MWISCLYITYGRMHHLENACVSLMKKMIFCWYINKTIQKRPWNRYHVFGLKISTENWKRPFYLETNKHTAKQLLALNENSNKIVEFPDITHQNQAIIVGVGKLKKKNQQDSKYFKVCGSYVVFCNFQILPL